MAASNFETVNLSTVDQAADVTLNTGVLTVNSSITHTGTITLAAATTAANATAGNVTFVDEATATAETFTNSGTGVMTVTLAADATADTIVNSSTGRVTVNQAASTGITTITLSANGAVDNINYANGTANTVGVGSTTAANRVVVTGWNWSAQDTVTLDTFQTTVTTAAAAPAVLQVVNAAGAILLASATADVAVFNFDFGGSVEVLAGNANGAAFVTHVGGVVTARAGNADDMYIMAFDNGNWYLYAATDLTSAGVVDTNLALIGVFNGALNDIGVSDFVLAD
ncbi:MAG: hypothetical protein EBU85_07505 [Actinobacteria bacterium]|nr:hypothetical protein [Actinomycetota bacterium]